LERSLTRYLSICIDAYDRRDTVYIIPHPKAPPNAHKKTAPALPQGRFLV
jgi:hypothetical protein